MQSTGIAGGPGQPGIISGIPQFTFSLNAPGEIPAGAYAVGIACTTNGGARSCDTYWTRPMTITANPAGGPAADQLGHGRGSVGADHHHRFRWHLDR